MLNRLSAHHFASCMKSLARKIISKITEKDFNKNYRVMMGIVARPKLKPRRDQRAFKNAFGNDRKLFQPIRMHRRQIVVNLVERCDSRR